MARDNRQGWERRGPRFAAAAAWTVKFVGADVDERGRVAVVGVFEDDNVFAAGMGAGQAQSEFVGFAAGIHEVADAQWIRQKTREPLGVADDVVVQIASVGVEESDLILDGTNHTRVAVADERDVVVDVEKSAAGIVVEVLHPAAHNFERLVVRDAEIPSEKSAAGGEGFFGVGQRGGSRIEIG